MYRERSRRELLTMSAEDIVEMKKTRCQAHEVWHRQYGDDCPFQFLGEDWLTDRERTAIEETKTARKRRKILDDLEQKMWQQMTGYETSIEVVPGGQNYGPVEIRIVVFDDDGSTIAYGYEDDNSGPFWEIGTVGDAVDAAIEAEAEIAAAGGRVWVGVEDRE